ncbi:hypothetical protein [Streptomyces mirabilis]|uniref:Uncharacterized protein n=1 Tax=Streptomyces mirabilis TaxID=68239 RepID=A0ABU3V569_9ACTN|nr:hypothetical protein [Streptomyces mirabilis]MCX5355664.1 hypothetical protein [Streptomyces mirabilis]MDU9001310.1 hypothetical protein [Streptomyces mirabilis]
MSIAATLATVPSSWSSLNSSMTYPLVVLVQAGAAREAKGVTEKLIGVLKATVCGPLGRLPHQTPIRSEPGNLEATFTRSLEEDVMASPY